MINSDDYYAIAYYFHLINKNPSALKLHERSVIHLGTWLRGSIKANHVG
jgi:hypothetical protein